MTIGLGIGIYSNTNIPTYSLFDPVFDGTYYLENTDPSGLPTDASPLTIVGWVKVPQPTSAQVMFGYGSNSNDTSQVEFIYNDGYRQVGFYWNQLFTPTSWSGDSSYVLSPNNWYFLALTYDGDITLTFHLYVNNIARHQVESNNLDTSENIIRVGLGMHHFSDFTNLFIGDVENIGIWNRCLTTDEIDAYYNIGRVNYDDIPEDILKALTPEVTDAQARSISISDLEVTGDITYIGWWMLNDGSGSTVADTSGNSNNGTIDGSGTFTSDVPYEADAYSLTFDGSTKVIISNDSIFNAYPISISVWIKTSVGDGGIVNKYISSTDNGYQIYSSGGNVYAWYFGQNSENSIYGGGPGLNGGAIADGNWHLVVFTVGPDGGALYVDTTLVVSQTWAGTPTVTNTTADITFGYYDTFFDGEIADVRIYNDILTQDNVNTLYAGNNPTTTLNLLTVSEGGFLDTLSATIDDIYCSDSTILEFGTNEVVGAGPVSFWNLTEDSGTRYDSVASNHLNEIDVTAAFNYTSTVQTNASTSFTDESILASSWSWDFGDGGTSTEQNPTYTYDSPGTYTVTLVINGGGHDLWTITHSIAAENPSASFTDDSPQNLGTAITFTDTSIFPNDSWSWNFGDGSGTSTEQNPSYTYNSPGTYTVTLAIADGASSAENTIVINESISSIWQIVDLTPYFNVIGVIPDGDAGEDGSGLDGDAPGTGFNGIGENNFYSIYSNPITLDGINFTFPSGNSNNTIYCNGQVVELSGATFDYVLMLGLGVNNGTSTDGPAPFIITYSDSTTDTINLQFSDWFSPQDYENEVVVLGGDNNLRRSDNEGPIYIYGYTLAIDRTKNAVSLTLPVYNNLDIFSITEVSEVSQPVMWVSADNINGLSNDDNVSTWNDLSGNSNNLTQGSSELQPVYKTNIVNGLPAILFTGSNLSGYNYTTGQYMTMSVDVPANYSVMTVMRESSADGYFEVAESIGNGTGYSLWQGYISTIGVEGERNSLVVCSDSHNDLYNPQANNENGWHICEGIFNGTYLAGYDGITSPNPVISENNPDSNNNGSSQALSSGNVVLGAYADLSLFFTGYIAETLIFNVALSDSDRAVIESYLLYKYQLQSQDQIYRVSFNLTPNSGTYTITANSQTTGNIDYNASASDVQTALDNLLGAGTTSVSGTYN